MTVIDRWTGRQASALRAALRMTQEAFAEHLGVGVRTVKDWSSRPTMTPSDATQEVLDAALEQAPSGVRDRFALLLSSGAPDQAEADGELGPAALTISLAIVTRPGEVLLVRRRDGEDSGITWQFPAGIVKPGGDPAKVAVSESLAETGIHSRIVDELGRRRHPVTQAVCYYFHCEYLAGQADNLDAGENDGVLWVKQAAIRTFIPEDVIFEPVLKKLMEASDDAAD